MPTRALHPCNKPGCPELARGGEKYCSAHKNLEKTEYPRRYNPETSKIYNSQRWRKFRKYYLNRHPVCDICKKQSATQLDHIKRVTSADDLYDESNIQSVCANCHSRKTIKEDGGWGKEKKQ